MIVKNQITSLCMTLFLLSSAWSLNAEDKPIPEIAREGKSVSLFDGKSLGKWVVGEHDEDGSVEVKDGAIVIGEGSPINGIVWKGKPIPTTNYELTLEAKRVAGNDFFAGITFPVKDSACSLILGGWGGGLTGLSSLDGIDASENETVGYQEFKNGQWYKVRIRVTDDRIDCWVDDKPVANVETTDRVIDVRIEMNLSKPFGIATYRTEGAVKNIEFHRLAMKKASDKEKTQTSATHK